MWIWYNWRDFGAVSESKNKFSLIKKMTAQINPEIRIFLENLLVEKDIEAEGELKEKMVSELHERLQTLFLQIIVEKLSPEELMALETPGKTADEVQGFLLEKVPGLKDEFKRAMTEFRAAFLEG